MEHPAGTNKEHMEHPAGTDKEHVTKELKCKDSYFKGVRMLVLQCTVSKQ